MKVKTTFLLGVFLTINCVMVFGQSIEIGDQHMYYERYKSAKQTFHEILQKDPGNSKAWLGLTKSYLSEEKIAKASDSLRLASEEVKASPFYKVAYGTLMLQKNNVEEATNNFSSALDETKNKNVEILSAVADAHISSKSGNPNYAIELLKKAIKRDKHNAGLYVQLGDAYRKLLDGSEAFKAYQKALDENDKYALAYHRMGKIFLTQNNPDQYIQYFKKALIADSTFAPSIYMLYAYEFKRDPIKSMYYYKQFIDHSDYTIQREYDLADLYYVNKQYSNAISKGIEIQSMQADSVEPRLYRLMSYSYAENKDTTQAIKAMQQYLKTAADSNIASRDYLAMVDFYSSIPGKDSVAGVFMEKALPLIKDSTTLFTYYKKMGDMAGETKDYKAQAKWLEKYYSGNVQATNLDLFNWALANYLDKDYLKADTVFGLYTLKYPEQSFGYYWQAKSRANQDSAMLKGLAVPFYQKLIDVLLTDTTNTNFQKWIIDAYEYLAAYEANVKKDFSASLGYFRKILEVDPANENAQKYVRILDKDVADKTQ